jgi:hypothetical protein
MIYVIDTGALIGEPGYVVEILSDLRWRDESKLATDQPTGPCFIEMQRHSQGPLLDEVDNGWGTRPVACISKDVRRLLLPILGKPGKLLLVADHDGEPKGHLASELVEEVERLNLQRWWEKDRKWVSLGQCAGPSIIVSTDKGFKRVKKTLRRHGLLVLLLGLA